MSQLRKWQSGYVIGLKPVYGGSIPSFLVSLSELEQMQALRMCGMGEGSRAVIQYLWMLVLLIRLLVLQ